MNKTTNAILNTARPVNLENSILRIQQVCEEDRQSKQGIYERIQTDIKDSVLTGIFTKCVLAINIYRSGIYYESKNKRLTEVMHIATEYIVNELFIAVIPCVQVTPIQQVASALSNVFIYDDVFDGIKTASEIIAVCADTNLFDIWTDPIELRSNYALNENTWNFIEKCKYVNPMICKPNPWVDNTHGGYIALHQSVLMNNKHHCEKQCLDAINVLQTIQWELDKDILKYDETSSKADTHDKRKMDALLVSNSKATYDELGNNTFYFVYRNDFRGRIYQQGYYVNQYGNDYKRASLSFAKKQLIK